MLTLSDVLGTCWSDPPPKEDECVLDSDSSDKHSQLQSPLDILQYSLELN